MNCLLSENYCSTTWHQIIKLHQEFLVYYKDSSFNALRDSFNTEIKLLTNSVMQSAPSEADDWYSFGQEMLLLTEPIMDLPGLTHF